jgi:hypothetical protein
MDKGERPFKGMGNQFGTQGLAGVGGHDDQRLPLEVEILVLFRIDPGRDPFYLFGRGVDDRFHC